MGFRGVRWITEPIHHLQGRDDSAAKMLHDARRREYEVLRQDQFSAAKPGSQKLYRYPFGDRAPVAMERRARLPQKSEVQHRISRTCAGCQHCSA